MRYETLECARCKGQVIVPPACAERVREGISYVLCDACVAAESNAG